MRVSPHTASRLTWVPNALTVARLLALPVIVWMLAADGGPTSAMAAWTFAAVAITDFIDGKLARALHAESDFGRIADPFADRMLVAVGLIGLIAIGRFGPLGPLIILVRDAALIIGVIVMRNSGIDLRVDMFGKTSSFLAMTAVGLALLSTATWIDILFWIAVVLSVASFGHYVWVAVGTLRGRGISTRS